VTTRHRLLAGFAAASMVALCALAIAADAPPPTAAPAATATPGDAADKGAADAKPGGRIEDQIRAKVEKRLSTQVVSVRKTPTGLYEVVAENEVFYVDAAVNYLVAGRIIDIKTHEDLTQARRDEVLRIDFKSLPFDHAVKSVRGDGSRMLVVFADPNCPYCKRLEKDLETLDNVTMYTFLYPILSPDSVDKSVAIWCATDRTAAWSSTMLSGKAPKLEGAACKNPVDSNLELGKKLQITATPTLVFSDGHRVAGAMPIDRVETLMAEASRGGPHTAAVAPGVPSSAATN
jgi:thiol:disulfide interchange protein DsbC